MDRVPSSSAHQCPETADGVLRTDFSLHLTGYRVLIRTCITATVGYKNLQGGLHSAQMCDLAHKILMWAQWRLLLLRAAHLPSAVNYGADLLTSGGPVAAD